MSRTPWHQTPTACTATIAGVDYRITREGAQWAVFVAEEWAGTAPTLKAAKSACHRAARTERAERGRAA